MDKKILLTLSAKNSKYLVLEFETISGSNVNVAYVFACFWLSGGNEICQQCKPGNL